VCVLAEFGVFTCSVNFPARQMSFISRLRNNYYTCQYFILCDSDGDGQQQQHQASEDFKTESTECHLLWTPAGPVLFWYYCYYSHCYWTTKLLVQLLHIRFPCCCCLVLHLIQPLLLLLLQLLYRVGQKSKLLYFLHIFANYWPIFIIFPPVDSGKNLLLNGMHTTHIISLHYLVKYNYPKTYNIYRW